MMPVLMCSLLLNVSEIIHHFFLWSYEFYWRFLVVFVERLRRLDFVVLKEFWIFEEIAQVAQ